MSTCDNCGGELPEKSRAANKTMDDRRWCSERECARARARAINLVRHPPVEEDDDWEPASLPWVFPRRRPIRPEPPRGFYL